MKIWIEIRDSATELHKAGANPGEILHWSRKKSLTEVQMRIHEILCQCEEGEEGEKVERQETDTSKIRHPGDIRGNTAVS